MGELINLKKDKQNQTTQNSSEKGIKPFLAISHFIIWLSFVGVRYLNNYLTESTLVGEGQKISLPSGHPYFHFIDETFLYFQKTFLWESLITAFLMVGSFFILNRKLKNHQYSDNAGSSNRSQPDGKLNNAA